MPEIWLSGVVVTAVLLGFRHGFDWDHIAALTDVTSSQTSPRRSMLLATLYAVGHAVMVLGLGSAAIVFAARLPATVDTLMERVVGVTLIALAVSIIWNMVKHPGTFPMRSRWMLVLSGLMRIVRRIRRRDAELVVIEHEHPHDADAHGHHELSPHVHAEPSVVVAADVGPVVVSAPVAAPHTHRHRHVAPMPRDPFMAYGTWSSFGVGLLHGLGAETPTQILVFAAAAHAGGTAASLSLLVAFIVGVLLANTVVAAAATFGFVRIAQRPLILIALSGATAAFSLAVGLLFLSGHSATLPAIAGG